MLGTKIQLQWILQLSKRRQTRNKEFMNTTELRQDYILGPMEAIRKEGTVSEER
jgi:hypothetical protein